MSNFTNSQKSQPMNTSERSRSYSFVNNPYNFSRKINPPSSVDYSDIESFSNKQDTNRSNLPQRNDTVTISTTPSICGSCDSGNGVPNSRQPNSLAQTRPYFASRLSLDSNNDGGYLSPKKDRLNSNNYRHRNEQKISNTWLRDTSRSSRGSTSSTESGFFSGDNSSCEGNSVNKSNSSNDRNKCLNFPPNHRNGRSVKRYPTGMPIPTPSTHFASSENFNAPAASNLPQPPQSWLLSRVKIVVTEEEQALEKSSNTFDYYNLKMLLTVKTLL